MEIHHERERGLEYRDAALASEGELHGFIEEKEGLSIGGIDTFLIDSERSTRTGVRADIVGIAETGHVVVVELKQSESGREGSRTALVQALEYAADFRSRSYRDLAAMYEEFSDDADRELRRAHADYFGLSDPLREVEFTFATEPRLVLLAEDFKPSDVDAARYLRDTNDVDITCVQVTPFEVDDTRFYGFETRLESKTEPTVPSRRAADEALPWLTARLEESYYERFGEKFGIEAPDQATERDGYYKGNRFVSASHHPDDLRYTFKLRVFDGPPRVEFGVSPTGHERLEQVVDEHRPAREDDLDFADTKWRRVRGDECLQPILADAELETVSPEISETVSRVLWNDDRFQSTWHDFLAMVEKWHEIFDRNLAE